MRPLILLTLTLIVAFGFVVPVQAQQAPDVQAQPVVATGTGRAAPKTTEPDVLSPQEILKKMGLLAYPMIAVSILAMLMIFFVVFTIRQSTVVSDAFMNSADALIRKQDYLGLLAVCNRRNECVARITAKALDFATKNPTASFDEVREVTEAEGSRQSSLLLQRVAYLADIGSMSPMLGLLGTVIGLITSFNHMSQVGISGNQHMNVAAGVYEALFNTAAGLGIGIPSLMVYSIYRGKVQRLISELEAASTHLMALLAAQYKRAARAAASRSVAAAPSHSDAAL